MTYVARFATWHCESSTRIYRRSYVVGQTFNLVGEDLHMLQIKYEEEILSQKAVRKDVDRLRVLVVGSLVECCSL